MTQRSSLILNPICVRRLVSTKSSASADCAGWLVRVKQGVSGGAALECYWFVLRGNLLLQCDDPESEPKSVVALENHYVELFDNFEEYGELDATTTSPTKNPENGESISSLKDYFAFLNVTASTAGNLKKDKKTSFTSISLVASAMQYAFRIFFPDSPTQEHFVFIADSDQSLQMWMRAIALASHEARCILAASKQPVVIETTDSSRKAKQFVSSEKSFSEIHDRLRQVVLQSCGDPPVSQSSS